MISSKVSMKLHVGLGLANSTGVSSHYSEETRCEWPYLTESGEKIRNKQIAQVGSLHEQYDFVVMFQKIIN